MGFRVVSFRGHYSHALRWSHTWSVGCGWPMTLWDTSSFLSLGVGHQRLHLSKAVGVEVGVHGRYGRVHVPARRQHGAESVEKIREQAVVVARHDGRGV